GVLHVVAVPAASAPLAAVVAAALGRLHLERLLHESAALGLGGLAHLVVALDVEVLDAIDPGLLGPAVGRERRAVPDHEGRILPHLEAAHTAPHEEPRS